MIISPIIPIWIMIIICIILIIMKSKNKSTFIRQIIIIVLIFVINLRIKIPSSEVQVMSNNLDVLFVIDSTISMMAEDYNGNEKRLEAVKKDCEYIVENLYGARFSVISFNNDAQILIPYTKDGNMAIEAISTIRTLDDFYAKGSSLNVAKEDIIKSLKLSEQKEGKKRIVFFISDGEITNGDKLESFSEIKKYVSNGAVLGYGTQKGGNMKVKDRLTEKEEYIEVRTTSFPYENAVSKIDENNLKNIAQDIGIDYINMEKQSKIDYKLKEIKQKLLQNDLDESTNSYNDIYYIFVVPLCFILIYEFINYKRRF